MCNYSSIAAGYTGFGAFFYNINTLPSISLFLHLSLCMNSHFYSSITISPYTNMSIYIPHTVLRQSGSNYSKQQIRPQRPERKVQGVRLNCIGDIYTLKHPAFPPEQVSESNPIFTQPHHVSEIAERVGLSLLAMKLPPSAAWDWESRRDYGTRTLISTRTR